MNVGIDEAGKGCIFGHVFASAVLWDDTISHTLLKDSKKLSKNQRLIMYDFILDNAIDYGIGFSTNTEIDTMNINNANILAMHRALNNLHLSPDFIYVDGSHNGEDVIVDAIESFKILKKQGIMIFDDAMLDIDKSKKYQTYEGVISFINMFKKEIEIMYLRNILIIKKISE